MQVGFIGLGIMGSRMAANLHKHGFALTVHNRSEDKAAPLVEQGAAWAATPADAARNADVLITMLAHPQAVTEMAFGTNGFLDALRPGTLWVDCSTVNPSFSRQMADEAKKRGLRFLDAPVAGTKKPAEEGKLTIIVGGDTADVEACQPLFNAIGSRVLHVGANGMGTSLKMVWNLLLATSIVAFSEAMALGQGLGFSQEFLLDTFIGSPMVAPSISGKRAKIEGGDYEADFPLRWMGKDAKLTTDTAYEVGVALPSANLIKELYQLAVQQGLGDEDFSAIYKFFNPQKR